jgi:hypothetical protein
MIGVDIGNNLTTFGSIKLIAEFELTPINIICLFNNRLGFDKKLLSFDL